MIHLAMPWPLRPRTSGPMPTTVTAPAGPRHRSAQSTSAGCPWVRIARAGNAKRQRGAVQSSNGPGVSPPLAHPASRSPHPGSPSHQSAHIGLHHQRPGYPRQRLFDWCVHRSDKSSNTAGSCNHRQSNARTCQTASGPVRVCFHRVMRRRGFPVRRTWGTHTSHPSSSRSLLRSHSADSESCADWFPPLAVPRRCGSRSTPRQ